MGNSVHMCTRQDALQNKEVILINANMDPVLLYDFCHPWKRVNVQGNVMYQQSFHKIEVIYKEDFDEINNKIENHEDDLDDEINLPGESTWSCDEIDNSSDENTS